MITAIFRSLNGGLVEKEIPNADPLYWFAYRTARPAWGSDAKDPIAGRQQYGSRVYALVGVTRATRDSRVNDREFAVYVEQP